MFVGPDADHRALAGKLVLDHDEFEDLVSLLRGGSKRVEMERA